MSDLIIKKDTSIQEALIEVVKRTDIDPERLEKFLDLQIKMENRQAEQAFNEALAKFQGECPVIQKNKSTSFTSKSGSTTAYNYAPLDEIVFVIKPILSKHGLSYSFDIEPGDMYSRLITTIYHKDGHSKKFVYSFDTIHDDQRMNSSQRRKSALTYAKRAGLENALGLVTTGEDDDAKRALDNPITEVQFNEIKELITSTKADEQKFLAYLNVKSFTDLTSYEAKEAILALKEKRAKCLK